MIEEVSIQSRRKSELLNLTAVVQAAVGKSGVREGICLVYLLHTTAGILVGEDEIGLTSDLMQTLERLVPERADYRHSDGNAHAHIKAGLIGASKEFVVRGGQLVIGTWQAILLCEFDGPKNRKVLIEISGER